MKKNTAGSRLKVLGEAPRATPVLDKFILVSLVGGLVGGLWLGIRLWVVRYGIALSSADYLWYRQLHAHIQVSLFFGSAINGFVIQSAPRLLGISEQFSRRVVLIVAASPVAGIVLAAIGSPPIIVSIMLGVGPGLSAAILIFRQGKRALRPNSLFVLTSLGGLVASGLADIGDPLRGLSLWWFAVGFALLGTAQLFMVNLLGGRAIGQRVMYVFYVCAVAGGALLYSGSIRPGAALLAGVVCAYWTMLRIPLRAERFLMMRRGFAAGFAWAGLSFLMLAVYPGRIDQTVHLLALGWGVSLLFPLSLHITAVVGGRDPKPSRIAALLFGLWQLVPLSRGILFDHIAGPGFLIVNASIIAVFWVYWIWKIAFRGGSMAAEQVMAKLQPM